MQFKIVKTSIPGCFELLPKIHKDNRGIFVKIFHLEAFKKLDLGINFREEYYSVSKKGVLRGLHFQIPPKAHVKLVYCVKGRTLDAVLDLRKKSPTYGKHLLLELSAKKANILYIPKGLAHGFYAFTEGTTLVYKTSTVYSPVHDKGIKWNSAGIPWPCHNPILSVRDKEFKPFCEEII